MTTKRLGRNGPEITRVGLGTWAIGGSGWKFAWGSQDDSGLHCRHPRSPGPGHHWIDTAAVYGLGHSEEVVGRAVKDRRDKVLLATKCSRKTGPGRGHRERAGCRERARGAGGEPPAPEDRPHRPVPDPLAGSRAPDRRGVDGDREGRESGKGALGRRVELQPVPDETAPGHPPHHVPAASVQHAAAGHRERDPPVLRRKRHRRDLLQPAADGAADRAPSAGNGCRRSPRTTCASRNAYFTEPALSRNLAARGDACARLPARSGRTVGELALAWVLCRPEVTAAIVGGRRPGQARGLVGAADWQLSKEDLEEVSRALAEREASS